MNNLKLAAPIVLGVVTLGVIGWTIHSLTPTDQRGDNNAAQARETAKRLDAAKRKMSPEQQAALITKDTDDNLAAMAVEWTKNGVYTSKEQSIRLSKLGDAAVATGTLPSADVDYLIATVSDPQAGSTSPGYVHYHAVYDLERVTNLTTDQKDRFLKACLPLLQSKEPLNQRCAIAAAKATHSSAAVAAARTMLTGDNENNRKMAKSYLDSLGVS